MTDVVVPVFQPFLSNARIRHAAEVAQEYSIKARFRQIKRGIILLTAIQPPSLSVSLSKFGLVIQMQRTLEANIWLYLFAPSDREMNFASLYLPDELFGRF